MTTSGKTNQLVIYCQIFGNFTKYQLTLIFNCIWANYQSKSKIFSKITKYLPNICQLINILFITKTF